MPNKNAESVANVLAYRQFPVWGVPKEFYEDLGTEFTAKVTRVIWKFALYNAHHSNTVECYHKMLLEILKNLASRRGNSPLEWENLPHLAAAKINSAKNQSTGYRPDLLQMGQIINREVQRLALDLSEDREPEFLDERMR